MKTAADPFRTVHGGGTWKPRPEMANPESYPVAHRGAGGPDHARGHAPQRAHGRSSTSRAGCRAAGAKGIDSLAGKPGVHPALMEDLATGRMSVAQIAQRIRHAARTTEGPRADARLRRW